MALMIDAAPDGLRRLLAELGGELESYCLRGLRGLDGAIRRLAMFYRIVRLDRMVRTLDAALIRKSIAVAEPLAGLLEAACRPPAALASASEALC